MIFAEIHVKMMETYDHSMIIQKGATNKKNDFCTHRFRNFAVFFACGLSWVMALWVISGVSFCRAVLDKF